MKRLIIPVFLMFFAPAEGDCWWSLWTLEDSTHYKISRKAIDVLPVSEYPDIHRFDKIIIEGTSDPIDDKKAHGYLTDAEVGQTGRDDAGKFNGGNFDRWWTFTDIKYKKLNFAGEGYNAYYYVAFMAHLLQDQAVPAHAANIYHASAFIGVPTNTDDLESWSDGKAPGAFYSSYFGREPLQYYYDKDQTDNSLILKTQSKLPYWTYPITAPVREWRGWEYWIDNNLHPYTGQAFAGDPNNPGAIGKWGFYGGPKSDDIFQYWFQPSWYLPPLITTASPEIAEEQLKEAASYTAGMLMAVSKSLPPLVQSSGINDAPGSIVPVIPGHDNTINFTLLDNRTSHITYRLIVDDKKKANDIISLSGLSADLGVNPDLNSLPKIGEVPLTWNGKLASGNDLPSVPGGIHTLYIVGFDEDQNPFDAVIGSFTVAGGPYLTVATPVSGPYVRFTGTSGLTPASINPAAFSGGVNLTMEPNGFPVALLKVKNPAGVTTEFPYALDGGIKTQSITDLADGRYELTVVDTAGNGTFAAFSLGTIVLDAKPEDSLAAYSVPADSFSANLKFHFADYYPLEKAELFDETGALLQTDALTGVSADMTYSFPGLYSPQGYTRDFYLDPAVSRYKVKLADREGHIKDELFSLSGARELFATTSDIDLLSKSLLPGAMGRSKADLLGVGLGSAGGASGPLVNAQSVGSYTVSVLTGEQADLSDGVEKTLGTGSYSYSVWDFRSLAEPPQNCSTGFPPENIPGCRNGTLAPETCQGYITCHTRTAMPPVVLKRYNRLVAATTPAPLTGVFKYFCNEVSPTDPDLCLSGNKPTLTVSPATLEAWGVRYANEGGHTSGGLGAQVPAGSNVTVKLADWLSLTFENVTTAGFVGASILTMPSLPGVLPLRALYLGNAGVGYTGKVTVAMKYDRAGITDEQLAYLEALKINDLPTRDFSRYTAVVDGLNQSVAFEIPAFGDFMLEVPSYASPSHYASADLIGSTPKIDVFAGVPFNVTPILPGSAAEQALHGTLDNHGLVSAGDPYLLGPTGQKFTIPASIKMPYDKTAIPAKALIEESLGIYQVSEDGTSLSRMGNEVLNTNKGELTAEISELHSLFVVAGSTYPAPPAPLSPDILAPVSHLAFGIPAYENGGQVMISGASPVFVDAYDPQAPGRITSGVDASYYLVDVTPESCTEPPTLTGPPGTCLNPVYTAPFMLAPGPHTIWYGSDDRAGNRETQKTKNIYVDSEAPQVVLSAAGSEVASGGSANIADKDLITITAIDPALNGQASGVGGIVFDISATPCTNFIKYPQNPGDCRQILYTGPLALPTGIYTIYYSAMDNVGNKTEIKSAHIEILPPPAGFTAVGPMTVERFRHTMTLLQNGKVLVTGGRNAGGYHSSAELYNPVTKTFTATGPMNAPRSYHTATLLPSGKVLLTGGLSNGAALSSAELYDPVLGTFSPTGSMLMERDAHTATLLPNGKVLIAGGDNEKGTAHATAELYDPATGAFSLTGTMGSAREFFTAIPLTNGRVLVSGGYNGSAPQATAELYDPATGRFSFTGQMGAARWQHSGTIMSGGKVLLVGGVGNNSEYLSSAEVYDPGSGTFSPTGSMSSVRSGAAVTLLPDGRVLVLVAGGADGSDAVTLAELYNPGAGTFSPTGSMLAKRTGHAAVLLTEGKVLISGGVWSGGFLSSAELYDPGFTGPVNAVLTSIAVAPENASVAVGGELRFTVSGNYSDGSSRVLDVFDGLTWSVDNSAVASVDNAGAVTGLADGTVRITVRCGLLSGDALLRVGTGAQIAVFSNTGGMTGERRLHTETLLPDGRVLLTGGRNSNGELYSAELFDPETKTFTAAGEMTAARARHTATLLANGRVLVAGGEGLSSAELYDPATGSFADTGPMIAARGGHTATLLNNGKVLIAGGYSDGEAIASTEIYDPASGTFASIGQMSSARAEHTAIKLVNGRVLVAGGFSGGVPLASAELYNPITETFSSVGSLAAARGNHAAVSLPDGRGLFFGGLGADSSYLSSAEVYDPGAGAFSGAGSLNTARSGLKAVPLPDGKILVAGGHDSGGPLTSSELYDPATGTSLNTGPLSAGRDEHTATLLRDGKVLVAGGAAGVSAAELYNSGFSGPSQALLMSIAVTPENASLPSGGLLQLAAAANYSDGSSRVLGPADGLTWTSANSAAVSVGADGRAAWLAAGTARITAVYGSFSADALLTAAPLPTPSAFSATGSMNTERFAHTMTLLQNGKVLVTGGRKGGEYFSSAELYDPAFKTFTPTGSMSAARGYHTASLLPDGRVLVAGGFGLSSAELYDPATGIFTPTGPMSVERDLHTATLLPDGRVLIAGGDNEGGTVHASAEVYDPATGIFTPTGSMGSAREFFTAALLPNGKVLAAGGYSGSAAQSSAELYDPVTGLFTPTGQMGVERWQHSMTNLADGRVLVVGGIGTSNEYLSSAELYDPASGTFSPTGSMSTVRGDPTVTLLPDGKVLVLVAGGSYGSDSVSLAELYDPAAGIFYTADSMSVGRAAHKAVLLPDGTVLLSGGVWSGGYLASAELYDPGYSDTTPPVISVMTAIPNTITPVNSYTTIGYELPEPGYVTLEVLSGSAPHYKIGSIYSGTLQPAGQQTAQWNGKTADNTALPDDEYLIRLTVADLAGNPSVPLDRTVFIDNSFPQIQFFAANPPSFNPAAGEKTRFVFKLSESALLNVTVKGPEGAVVKNLVVNSLSPAGTLSFYWDGKNNSDEVVQSGSYHVTVSAIDRTGNLSEASGGERAVVPPDYPSITGLNETPDPFLPDGDVNQVSFNYHLTAAHLDTVTITISHPMNGVIKTLTATQGSGDHAIPWDGLDNNGQPAPDGAYNEIVSITVDGHTATAQGAFSLLRLNTTAVQSSAANPVVTVQYAGPPSAVSVAENPPLTTDASVALQTQAQGGTTLASPIFDIVASQQLSTPPVLRFKYDPAFDGESLALYKYSVSAGAWIPVSSSYVVDLANNELIITLDPDMFLGSLFALMRSGDSTPPVSTLSVGKPSFEAFGLKVLTPDTLISVSAMDEGTGASGVDKIFCAVDQGAFTDYTAPFALTWQGAHTVRCLAKDKAGNFETAKELLVSVMPLEAEAVGSATGLTVSGSAAITGATRANAILSLNGNAKITGDAIGSDVVLKGKAAVSGKVTKTANTLAAEPIPLDPVAQAAAASNNNAIVPEQYLQNGWLKISSKAILELPAGTYYFKGVDLSGGASLVLKGNVEIMVEGPVSVSGGAALNAEGPASRLKLFVNSELPVTLSGGAKAAAYVYTPKSALKLTGNVQAGGHWFAKSVDISGNGNIIQSGEELPAALVGVRATDFTTSADETFRLGEVYVFPNPARGGEAPTFHIETGIAESVKITIYTISGRHAHDYTLTGIPAVLDDGNGLSYAYEYAWNGHIPSGVYLYHIETQKAGQKLKKTGKFAVIR